MLFGKGSSLQYITDRLFFEEPEITPLSNIFIWNIRNTLSHVPPDVDLIIIETDRFFSKFLLKKGFITIPEMLSTRLDISAPLDEICNKFTNSAKKDIQRIKKQGYTYEITTNPNKMNFFYEHIYKPYILHRLKKLLLPGMICYDELRAWFEIGKLMLIKDKDEYVAGGLFFIDSSNKATFWIFMGIALDTFKISNSVGSTLYYYAIIWSKKNGFKHVYFGGTPPFLTDGRFIYKRKWVDMLEKSKTNFEILGLKIYREKSIQNFIENNPFVYTDGTKLKAMFYLSDQPTIEKIQRIYKKYYISGLEKIDIIFNGHIDKDVKEFVDVKFNGKIIISNKFDL
jgi:hypothetical protein